jgi:beta-lactamase regulating signal transducer with metallopeptidase domain
MTAWLLAWLWESLVLTLAVALFLNLARSNAATRHFAWGVALAAVVWLGFVSSPYGGPTPGGLGSDANGMGFAPEPLLYIGAASPLFLSTIFGVWVAVALVKLARMLPSLHAVFVLRDRCRPVPADMEATLPLWLEVRDRGRRTELVICEAVAGATVLGFQRPCIALPSSLVGALSADELDQVILHEYAHVQRWDDWGRLGQALVQAALWIHPAVALIARALNREREMACDEWVVARTGMPRAFARCLTHAAEVRGRVRAEPVIFLALFGARHELVHRVDRLLATRGGTRRGVSRRGATVAACAVIAASIQLNALPLFGEYDVELPRVAAPARFIVAAATVPIAGVTPATLSTTRRTPVGGTQETPDPYVPHASYVPPDPHGPEPALLLNARAFEGVYRSQDATSVASDQPLTWRAAAVPGIEIANAARKTSVGLAGVVSRASVALARRF